MRPQIACLLLFAPLALFQLGGCATADHDPFVAAVDGQLKSRSMQTREVAASSRRALVDAVIGTLQDHHFRIVEVDPVLGTITAYQLHGPKGGWRFGERTNLTVIVRDQEDARRFRVRASMSVGLDAEDSPELYRQFFLALEQTLARRSQGQRDTAPRRLPETRSVVTPIVR